MEEDRLSGRTESEEVARYSSCIKRPLDRREDSYGVAAYGVPVKGVPAKPRNFVDLK